MHKNKKGILSPSSQENYWNLQSQAQTYDIWKGYSFENLCLKHHWQIKVALGISHIMSDAYVFAYTPKKGDGIQIDLLFDRADNVINICEIKYCEKEFKISKSYASILEKRKEIFKNAIKTNKSIFTTFITPFGLLDNEYKKRIVTNSITLNDLFR